MINFPCPKKEEEFLQLINGVYCSDCNQTLIDLTNRSLSEVQEVKERNPDACVILNESMARVETFNFKRFALALMIVMGASGFVLGSQCLETNLNEVRTTYLQDSLEQNNLSVSVTRKDGRLEYAWVQVSCGDSVFRLTMNEDHFFSLNLGEKFRGMMIEIRVRPSSGKMKMEVIKDFDPEEFYSFNFSYADRSFYRKIRGKF